MDLSMPWPGGESTPACGWFPELFLADAEAGWSLFYPMSGQGEGHQDASEVNLGAKFFASGAFGGCFGHFVPSLMPESFLGHVPARLRGV